MLCRYEMKSAWEGCIPFFDVDAVPASRTGAAFFTTGVIYTRILGSFLRPGKWANLEVFSRLFNLSRSSLSGSDGHRVSDEAMEFVFLPSWDITDSVS